MYIDGLGSLPEVGTAYYQTSVVRDFNAFESHHDEFDSNLWEGAIRPILQEQWKKNAFLQSLEEDETNGEDDVADEMEVESNGTNDYSKNVTSKFNESMVSVWSDFNKVHLHHRSIVSLTLNCIQFDFACYNLFR